MEVSGVRSSWLTIDTNSLFIRSTSRRWVTSRNTTTAPVTCSSSISGVAVTSTGIWSPSARVYRSSSALVTTRPRMASVM